MQKEGQITREYYSFKDLETITGLSRSTLHHLIASEALPAVRIGRSVRVPRAELEKFMQQNTVGAA